MSISKDILESAIIVLSRSEIFHDSVRNELYKFFRNSKKRIPRKAVYHLVMEVSRRQNLLDEYFAIVKEVDSHEFDIFILNSIRIATYLIKEEFYSSGISPPFKTILDFIESIISPKQSKELTKTILGYLNQINYIQKKDLMKKKSLNEKLGLEYYHPTWFVEYMNKMIGERNTVNLMIENNKYKQIWLRFNFLKENMSKESIIRRLKREGVTTALDTEFNDVLEVIKAKKAPVSTKLFRNKIILAQDKTSSAISHILSPKPDELIVDLACAPGMKFSHIFALMKTKGTIIGIDVSSFRLKRMKTNHSTIFRKFLNLHLVCADSRFIPLKRGIADRILLDAPCSSSGIYRAYPDHKWRDPKIFEYFSQMQNELFIQGLEVLKKDGLGVYSVCSIHHKEGEQVIENFLEKIKVLPIKYGNEPYIKNEKGIEFSSDILKCKRTFPHLDNTNSFFICKFNKK